MNFRAFLLLILACTMGWQCGKKADKGQKQTRPTPVKVERIEQGPIRNALLFVGELFAKEQVELAAQMTGRVQSVLVHIGDPAKANASLAQINDTELQAGLSEAKANLEMARAGHARSQVESKNAQTELARMEPLAANDLITAQDLDNARAKAQVAQASLQVARAQIVQAEARVRVLAQNIADARIAAPFSGWVAKRYVDAGAVVAPGTPIVKVVRTHPMVVRFQVPERHVGAVRTSMAKTVLDVTMHVDAYRTETFSGQVVRMAPVLELGTRAAVVEAEVPNPDGRLMPGMYGRVTLLLAKEQQAMRLPMQALMTNDTDNILKEHGQGTIFVLQDKHVQKVSVKLGVIDGDYGEVLEGLKMGDLVVVQGQSLLQDGHAVQIVATKQPKSLPTTELAKGTSQKNNTPEAAQ